jgi:hypothetical protein
VPPNANDEGVIFMKVNLFVSPHPASFFRLTTRITRPHFFLSFCLFADHDRKTKTFMSPPPL